MSDILDEASEFLECKECPWYKSCVMPMRITPDDLKRQIPSSGSLAANESEMMKYITELSGVAQNFVLEGCPIFVKRLRKDPKLAEKIKKMMQNWGMEDEDKED